MQTTILGMNLSELSMRDISEELTDLKRDLAVLEDYEKGNISYSEMANDTMMKPTDKTKIQSAMSALYEEKYKRMVIEKYPDAKCALDGALYFISSGNKDLGAGFSKASAWSSAVQVMNRN